MKKGRSLLGWIGLFLSFSSVLTLVVAVGVAVFLDPSIQRSLTFSSENGKAPSTPLPSTLTAEQVNSYHRDGFVLIRQLVPPGEQLEELVQEAKRLYQKKSILDFLFSSTYAKLAFQIWRHSSPFARLAFESALPSMAAQLLGYMDETTTTTGGGAEEQQVRILKDAVFGYTSSGRGCGFHIDDRGFWPAEDDTTGVNLWLALSPMSAQEGGGIRLANQSLTQGALQDECLAVIRTNGTCTMQETSPSCHDKIDHHSLTYDMEPGDAILWDRWTFHRSVPFQNENDGNGAEPKLRYTLRYIPGNAVPVKGGFLHKSVVDKERFEGPYYPQVWPHARPEEIPAVVQGLEADATLGRVANFLLRSVKRKIFG